MATRLRPASTQSSHESEVVRPLCFIKLTTPSNSSNFLPATGKLQYLSPPTGKNVRVDTGVVQGDEVSIFYDPMISKLIAWGPERSAALRTLTAALQNYHIVGLPTNIEFVLSAANHPKFVEGGVDTSFLVVRASSTACCPLGYSHSMTEIP